MKEALKQKLDSAMRELAKKPPATPRFESVKESEERKKKTKTEFDEIRLQFTGNEITQLRERYKEIEPKMPPTSQKEVEPQQYDNYEFYFITRLLDF